jgi:pyruvate/2-oxoglutarate dehydrogenase complex dihydrolipoamide acyltransferase (E2) component
MAIPLFTPRINNNDDTVRLTKILVDIGSVVRKGDPVIDIETDKAVFTVESEHDGYLIGVLAEEGATLNVGSILAWIGESPNEPMPAAASQNSDAGLKREASLKAMLLLSKHHLSAASLPVSPERLSAADVERYVEANGLGLPETSAPLRKQRLPQAPGRMIDLNPAERGMLRTVEWHKDEAAAAYLEIGYDASGWEHYAAEFQKSKRLLLNPLLSLFAWRLVQLARAQPRINATIVNGSKYVYDHVNLGFTIQAGERLYVVVVPEAEALTEAEFVDRLGAVQRAAMKNALDPAQTSGATIAFSSMARWAVTRHVPVLAPHTTLMVAHTAPQSGSATLGATYDHRVLSGWDVVGVLQNLSHPSESL